MSPKIGPRKNSEGKKSVEYQECILGGNLNWILWFDEIVFMISARWSMHGAGGASSKLCFEHLKL